MLNPSIIDALNDRQNRLRSALFVYLCIAFRNLPAWADDWKGLQDAKVTPESRANILANIEAFDVLTQEVDPETGVPWDEDERGEESDWYKSVLHLLVSKSEGLPLGTEPVRKSNAVDQ